MHCPRRSHPTPGRASISTPIIQRMGVATTKQPLSRAAQAVPVADTDIEIDDDDDNDIFAAEIKVNGRDPEDLLSVNGALPGGIVATAYNPETGILRLDGRASHSDYAAAILQVRVQHHRPSGQPEAHRGHGIRRRAVESTKATRSSTSSRPAAAPTLDLDANNSSAGGADSYGDVHRRRAGDTGRRRRRLYHRCRQHDHPYRRRSRSGSTGSPDDTLSIAGSLPGGITDSGYDADHRRPHAQRPGDRSPTTRQRLRQVVFSTTQPAVHRRSRHSK